MVTFQIVLKVIFFLKVSSTFPRAIFQTTCAILAKSSECRCTQVLATKIHQVTSFPMALGNAKEALGNAKDARVLLL